MLLSTTSVVNAAMARAYGGTAAVEASDAYDLNPGVDAVRLMPEGTAIRSEFTVTPCPKCDEAPARIVPGRVVAGVILSAELRCACGTSWPTLNREAFADG